MAREIERRFLCIVDQAPAAGTEVVQGYLASGRPTIRVRRRGFAWYITIKGAPSGLSRIEFEFAIPAWVGRSLIRLCGPRIVRKLRSNIGRWELDRFLGPLEGLVILEIELSHVGEILPPVPAGIRVLREVTYNPAYSNARLSLLGPQEAATFVASAYERMA